LVLLNRCSDLLFIIARRLGRAEAERESMWQREETE
jgi:cob(I)alamin adenosyltransferase